MCVHAWRSRRLPASGSASSSVVDLVRVEQHGLQLVGQAERVDPGRPQLGNRGRRPVVGEPLDHPGRLDERVVACGTAPSRDRVCPARVRRRHATPFSATLIPMNGASGGPGVQTAVLGEHVVGPDRVGMVVGHPAGAVRAAGLLVGDPEVDQIAGRAEAPTARWSARCRKATAIDAVRLSMSTAPRPHTSAVPRR